MLHHTIDIYLHTYIRMMYEVKYTVKQTVFVICHSSLIAFMIDECKWKFGEQRCVNNDCRGDKWGVCLPQFTHICHWSTAVDIPLLSKFIRSASLIARIMGPTWGPPGHRQDPGGPHVGPMNFAIWDVMYGMKTYHIPLFYSSAGPKYNKRSRGPSQ